MEQQKEQKKEQREKEKERDITTILEEKGSGNIFLTTRYIILYALTFTFAISFSNFMSELLNNYSSKKYKILSKILFLLLIIIIIILISFYMK